MPLIWASSELNPNPIHTIAFEFVYELYNDTYYCDIVILVNGFKPLCVKIKGTTICPLFK